MICLQLRIFLSSDDDDEPLPVKKKTSKKSNPHDERGKMEFKHGNIMHYINGKKVSTETAYNTYNWAAYVAGAVTMYHTAIGNTTNINLEVFSAILTNAFMVYGPKQQLELPAVAACMEYINDNDVDPWDAMSTASRAIKANAPARVYSDAVITGNTGMVVDLSTGDVVVPQQSGLSVRATQALAPLLVATVPKPSQAMEEVIADLGHHDRNLASVEDFLQKMLDSDLCPDITENNSFRKLSKVPGLMSNDLMVRAKHGTYQGIYTCLDEYHEEPIDLLVVPEYTLGMTGSYDSMGTVSRVIPLPKSVEHYSATLFSTVESYEDGLRSLLKLEEERKANPEVRKTAGSARAALHAPYATYYKAMREEPQGTTPKGLRYVRLVQPDFVGMSELLDGAQRGRFDDSPAMVRVSDFFHAQVKSLEGFCIVSDLPMMVGLYVSPAYVQKYFKKSLIDRSGRPKCIDGFYVLKPGPKGTEARYSAWIEKYIFAHMAGSIMGPEAKEKILEHYMAGYKEVRKGNDTIRLIIRDLRLCYDNQYPSLVKGVILTPGYSMRKAFKYRTIFCDFDVLEDDEFQEAVKAVGGVSPPPDVPDPIPTPSDTGESVAVVEDVFPDWEYAADDDGSEVDENSPS